MKKRFINSCISLITKYGNYSKRDIQKLEYGLEGIYLTFTKMVVIFALAFILGIFKEVIIVLILFNAIRYTGFGFHAEKSYQCLIISIVNFILIPWIFLNIKLSNIMSLSIAIFCIINYLIFAPADTIKRPLPNRKKRIIRKVITVLIGIIYTFLIIILNNKYYTSLVISSMIILMIVINPLTYMIFKQPYNNYKKLS